MVIGLKPHTYQPKIVKHLYLLVQLLSDNIEKEQA